MLPRMHCFNGKQHVTVKIWPFLERFFNSVHLGCPGGKQINIKFSFLGELSL